MAGDVARPPTARRKPAREVHRAPSAPDNDVSPLPPPETDPTADPTAPLAARPGDRTSDRASDRMSDRNGTGPTTGPNTGPGDGDEDDGLDAADGEWLFKHNELVLGPVGAAVLIDKIKKDELGSDTPIARDGQAFEPMKAVRLFREAIGARDDEKRAAAEERAWRAAVARTRAARALLLVALFATPAAAAALGAHKVFLARPWDDAPRWLVRVPPLVDLPQRPPEVKPALPAPAASSPASSATPDGEGVDRTGDGPGPSTKKPPTFARVGGPGGGTGGETGGGTGRSGSGAGIVTASKKGMAETGPGRGSAGGLPETLTNAQAIEPLRGAQADLKACFKAEMEDNPDVPAQIVLSYTVTEAGRATNIALDARELRNRPVVACVQKAIGALQWPRFTGERKNVSVPFKLGKPGPKK
jgi:hypothetical protein